MGKNQAYKAMQRSRVGSSHGGPDEIEDGMMDGSFHTPEWHVARLANLSTSHTVTWEEFKMKQKEDALKRGEQEADKDRMMREYRAQLDAERERKLAQGRNRSNHKSKDSNKKDQDRSSKRHSSRKRKRSRRRSSDSSSSSESSSSDEEERESRRSESRSKRTTRKERKHSSRSSRSKNSCRNDSEEGPLPLSRFFGNMKSE